MSSSTEPVNDPSYWKNRLHNCRGELHRAVFNGSIDQFNPLQEEHQRVLRHEIRATDKILDAGCGYGRLAGLLPGFWRGQYWGYDISPELIQLAKMIFPESFTFYCRDIRHIPSFDKFFDVALVCSVRPMMIRNCGQEEWDVMEKEINRVAKRVRYLTFGEWD